MAHHTTHRRNLASIDSKPSIDPTHKKHPISTTSSTTKPHHKDPTIPPPSTVQIISNHFSKLYTNHKILTTLKKPSSTCHCQEKPMIACSNMDNSCTTLTKSKSQRGRNVKEKVVKVKVPFEVHDMDNTLLKQKVYEINKKPSSKKHEEEQPHEGCDEVKRPSFSLAVNGGGGRRRSFCSSQTELADFFSCNGVKVVSVDMPPFMQIHAVNCARKAHDSLEKFTARTLAFTLKKEFDGTYGPAWHCIVGTSFGSFVTHSVGGFMYFSMDHKLYILLFKTTVQKAG